ncbi:hypothetical protein Vretifemale_4098 [Volvox reticuliferus]|nr:hypothetical protein Vretifemale_4098 [Volvox reticuliferus]
MPGQLRQVDSLRVFRGFWTVTKAVARMANRPHFKVAAAAVGGLEARWTYGSASSGQSPSQSFGSSAGLYGAGGCKPAAVPPPPPPMTANLPSGSSTGGSMGLHGPAATAQPSGAVAATGAATATLLRDPAPPPFIATSMFAALPHHAAAQSHAHTHTRDPHALNLELTRKIVASMPPLQSGGVQEVGHLASTGSGGAVAECGGSGDMSIAPGGKNANSGGGGGGLSGQASGTLQVDELMFEVEAGGSHPTLTTQPWLLYNAVKGGAASCVVGAGPVVGSVTPTTQSYMISTTGARADGVATTAPLPTSDDGETVTSGLLSSLPAGSMVRAVALPEPTGTPGGAVGGVPAPHAPHPPLGAETRLAPMPGVQTRSTMADGADAHEIGSGEQQQPHPLTQQQHQRPSLASADAGAAPLPPPLPSAFYDSNLVGGTTAAGEPGVAAANTGAAVAPTSAAAVPHSSASVQLGSCGSASSGGGAQEVLHQLTPPASVSSSGSTPLSHSPQAAVLVMASQAGAPQGRLESNDNSGAAAGTGPLPVVTLQPASAGATMVQPTGPPMVMRASGNVDGAPSAAAVGTSTLEAVRLPPVPLISLTMPLQTLGELPPPPPMQQQSGDAGMSSPLFQQQQSTSGLPPPPPFSTALLGVPRVPSQRYDPLGAAAAAAAAARCTSSTGTASVPSPASPVVGQAAAYVHSLPQQAAMMAMAATLPTSGAAAPLPPPHATDVVTVAAASPPTTAMTLTANGSLVGSHIAGLSVPGSGLQSGSASHQQRAPPALGASMQALLAVAMCAGTQQRDGSSLQVGLPPGLAIAPSSSQHPAVAAAAAAGYIRPVASVFTTQSNFAPPQRFIAGNGPSAAETAAATAVEGPPTPSAAVPAAELCASRRSGGFASIAAEATAAVPGVDVPSDRAAMLTVDPGSTPGQGAVLELRDVQAKGQPVAHEASVILPTGTADNQSMVPAAVPTVTASAINQSPLGALQDPQSLAGFATSYPGTQQQTPKKAAPYRPPHHPQPQPQQHASHPHLASPTAAPATSQPPPSPASPVPGARAGSGNGGTAATGTAGSGYGGSSTTAARQAASQAVVASRGGAASRSEVAAAVAAAAAAAAAAVAAPPLQAGSSRNASTGSSAKSHGAQVSETEMAAAQAVKRAISSERLTYPSTGNGGAGGATSLPSSGPSATPMQQVVASRAAGAAVVAAAAAAAAAATGGSGHVTATTVAASPPLTRAASGSYLAAATNSIVMGLASIGTGGFVADGSPASPASSTASGRARASLDLLAAATHTARDAHYGQQPQPQEPQRASGSRPDSINGEAMPAGGDRSRSHSSQSYHHHHHHHHHSHHGRHSHGHGGGGGGTAREEGAGTSGSHGGGGGGQRGRGGSHGRHGHSHSQSHQGQHPQAQQIEADQQGPDQESEWQRVSGRRGGGSAGGHHGHQHPQNHHHHRLHHSHGHHNNHHHHHSQTGERSQHPADQEVRWQSRAAGGGVPSNRGHGQQGGSKQGGPARSSGGNSSTAAYAATAAGGTGSGTAAQRGGQAARQGRTTAGAEERVEGAGDKQVQGPGDAEHGEGGPGRHGTGRRRL